MAKNVGMVFDLIVPKPLYPDLWAAADTATFAENTLWQLWRAHDPVSGLDLVAMREEKAKTGRWPKLPAYKLENTREGASPTKICGALCPGFHSGAYDAIANHVRHFYPKTVNRRAYLYCWKRLPISKDRRIRFRGSIAKIHRDETSPQYWALSIQIIKGAWWTFGLKLRGPSRYTLDWIDAAARGDEAISCGTISEKRKRGKRIWQVSLARARREGEREQVRESVPGRELLVWAPLEQEQFIRTLVTPVNGRPWFGDVQATDLCVTKARFQKARANMGAHYAQSERSGSIGHGRNRAIRGKLRFTERYENRVKDWIENRSAYLVRSALRSRCGGIRMEDLTKRDASKLRLGSFPYFRLLQRVEQKAADAGLEFALFTDLESVEKLLTAAAE